MDQQRFENANRLWKSGHVRDAAREFHAMAMEANDSDEKAATLANEHKCYCQIQCFDEARAVMREIRKLSVKDPYVRMIIDIGDAIMMTSTGKFKEGESLFENILRLNPDELQSTDSRHLYEEIQQRRGFALTNLERYAEAVSVLEEAAAFPNACVEDMQSVWFYLGICYAALSKQTLAKEAYLRAIAFGMRNTTEADAHYRIAVVYFVDRAFAQAKHHLEIALQLPHEALSSQLRKFIYQQMSRICHYLGESEEEKKYLKLAQAS